MSWYVSGPVDLGARRASRGATGLAGDLQDAAWLVNGRVAVEQLAGHAVHVVDAAS